jgi:arginyl-tRNA synthetase
MLEKAGDAFDADAAFKPETPEERRLALLLLRFGDTVRDTAASLEPSRLCRYLYAVATEFSTFYSACPVLKADDPAIVASRLRLVSLVRRVLADGLDCLGIAAPPRM